MKKLIFAAALVFTALLSCNSSKNLSIIQPKTGNIEIPANGDIRVWNNLQHGSFEVELSNSNATQSVEVYFVKRNGTEKWISPSLQANSKLKVHIPADGHLYIKNFNPNSFTVAYQVID